VVDVVVVDDALIQSHTVWQSTVLFTIDVNWLYRFVLFKILLIIFWTISGLQINPSIVDIASVTVSQFVTPVHDKLGPWYTTSFDEVPHPHGLFPHPQGVILFEQLILFFIYFIIKLQHKTSHPLNKEILLLVL
jgi:hypothetical protein